MSNFRCFSHLSFSRIILADEKSIIQWVIFLSRVNIWTFNGKKYSKSFFSRTLKTSHLNLTDFQYFWNCSIFEIYEIDIIIIYKCSAYMAETKFQMYFQKIYSFIKFSCLHIEFFQFKNWKNIFFFFVFFGLKFWLFCIFRALKETVPTYRCSLFRCFVSYFIQIIKL